MRFFFRLIIALFVVGVGLAGLILMFSPNRNNNVPAPIERENSPAID